MILRKVILQKLNNGEEKSMNMIKAKIKRFFKEEEGQALSEYGLIIGIIAVACITILVALKDKLVQVFTSIKDAL